MEKSQNFLTIKAFAEASGRSQQTIYKQLSTRLAEYCREIDGQKYIEHRALKEVFNIDSPQPIQPEENNSFNRNFNPARGDIVAVLQQTIDTLQQQLEVKDKQIADLTEANKELAQSINKARANELAGTMQQMLPEGESAEAPGEDIELVQDEGVPEPAPELSEPPKAPEELLRGLSWREIIKLKLTKGKSRRES